MALPEKMPESFYSVVKEAMADKKINSLFDDGKESLFLDELTKLYDAAQAKEKVQLANQDLVKQRDGWTNGKKELEDKIKLYEQEVEKLKQGQLSEDERKTYLKLKETGMNSDVEAKVNSLTSQIQELQNTLKAEQEAKRLETESAKQARKERELELLKSDLLKKLADVKIDGNRAEIAIESIMSKGMARVEDTEKGLVRKFRLYDNGKELESDLDTTVAKFAQQNDFLVSGTKRGGTGESHERYVNSGGRASFNQMLSTQ